jgi:amidase
MPFQRPDDDDVIALAAELAIQLTETEARLFRVRLHEQVEALERFHELRIEEERLPLVHLRRDPGYRPSVAEDPLNAFIRRCRVEGAENGPLRGKSVGLKDHTAVACVPLTLGSHFMDGYIPEFDATIVTGLLAAGATIVGKMNMEDFSFGGPGFNGVGVFGLEPTIDYVGPLTRAVEDLAQVLQCVAGRDGYDPR